MSSKRPGRISKSSISVPEVLAHVSDPAAGGTVLFIGTVRDNNSGRRVKQLEYDVYGGMAERNLAEIEKEVKRLWPVKKVAIIHRRGKLNVGEVSVVVAVSGGHRAEAFEACRYAIEALKRTAPIWKRETTDRGRTVWVEGAAIERLEPLRKGTKTRGLGSRRRGSQRSSS
jgi:molybdopterin synthase catalytic subunit